MSNNICSKSVSIKLPSEERFLLKKECFLQLGVMIAQSKLNNFQKILIRRIAVNGETIPDKLFNFLFLSFERFELFLMNILSGDSTRVCFEIEDGSAMRI